MRAIPVTVTQLEPAFAMVQEADVSDALAVLKARVPGATHVLVVAALPGLATAFVLDPEARRAAFGGRAPRGVAYDKARGDELVGAKVTAKGARHFALVLATGAPARLEARGGRIALVRGATASADDVPLADASAEIRLAWAEEARRALGPVASYGLTLRSAALARALARADAKLARRAGAIEGDLAKIAQVLAIAAKAAWFAPVAKSAPRGATQLEVTDWSTGEAVALTLRLDPARPAAAQVEALFHKAKRLRLGRQVAEDRLAGTRSALRACAEARAVILSSTSAEEVEAAASAAKAAAPRDLTLPSAEGHGGTRATRGAGQGRAPFRTFTGPSGVRLLVGRGAEDNDALTFRVASPHDLWLHAKDQRGAHVILPLRRGKNATEGALIDAAHLAAHFSDAREEAVVDVQYTLRKHLRRPRGAAKGAVIVEREKVLALRVDRARLLALLDGDEG